jgi:acyl-coenzyme A thioesterase PaaI-like protein
MTQLFQLFADFKRTGDASGLLATIPYLRFMGIEIDAASGSVLATLRYGDHLIGNPSLPALHGGTIGALLESTAIFQVLWEAETVVLPKTITITVDYLRPGRPVDTFARGVVTRQGKRVVNVRAQAWQEDTTRPIALAGAHFLIRPAEG